MSWLPAEIAMVEGLMDKRKLRPSRADKAIILHSHGDVKAPVWVGRMWREKVGLKAISCRLSAVGQSQIIPQAVRGRLTAES